jgi:hypothetical protein
LQPERCLALSPVTSSTCRLGGLVSRKSSRSSATPTTHSRNLTSPPQSHPRTTQPVIWRRSCDGNRELSPPYLEGVHSYILTVSHHRLQESRVEFPWDFKFLDPTCLILASHWPCLFELSCAPSRS